MKIAELRSKGILELNKELKSLLKIQFGLRMQKISQQTENNNVNRFRVIRRDIARIRTLLVEKIEKKNGRK